MAERYTPSLMGIRYRWSGWLGCQLLRVFEWRRPPAGTTRTLDFGNGKPSIVVSVFTTERKPVGQVPMHMGRQQTGRIDEHVAKDSKN